MQFTENNYPDHVHDDRKICPAIIYVMLGFNSQMNNSSLKPLDQSILNDSIDWDFTHQWLIFNPYDTPTCEKKSRLRGPKIKKSNPIYPTADILQRNYL